MIKSKQSQTSFEVQRQLYKPDRVRVLFIGESPPASGKFFYAGDSFLFEHTLEAFQKVYPACPDGKDFLEFFQAHGCYLVDLCSKPINGLSRQARKSQRERGIQHLTQEIEVVNAGAIITVMKGIKSQVQRAMNLASVCDRPAFFLPFPAQSHQHKYVDELIIALHQLKQSDILA